MVNVGYLEKCFLAKFSSLQQTIPRVPHSINKSLGASATLYIHSTHFIKEEQKKIEEKLFRENIFFSYFCSFLPQNKMYIKI